MNSWLHVSFILLAWRAGLLVKALILRLASRDQYVYLRDGAPSPFSLSAFFTFVHLGPASQASGAEKILSFRAEN